MYTNSISRRNGLSKEYCIRRITLHHVEGSAFFLTRWIVCILALFMLVLDAVESMAGCRPLPALRLQILVFNDDRWKVVDQIDVHQNGLYYRATFSFETGIYKMSKGVVPRHILMQLQLDTHDDAVKVSEGVPTYSYGQDDFLLKHPLGIERLLEHIYGVEDVPGRFRHLDLQQTKKE